MRETRDPNPVPELALLPSFPDAKPERVLDPYLVAERCGGRFALIERRDLRLVLLALVGSESLAEDFASRIADGLRTQIFVAVREVATSTVFEPRSMHGKTLTTSDRWADSILDDMLAATPHAGHVHGLTPDELRTLRAYLRGGQTAPEYDALSPTLQSAIDTLEKIAARKMFGATTTGE
jgi:hypothetical protein